MKTYLVKYLIKGLGTEIYESRIRALDKEDAKDILEEEVGIINILQITEI